MAKKTTTAKMLEEIEKENNKFKEVIRVPFIIKNKETDLYDIVDMEVDEETLETRVIKRIPTRVTNKNKGLMELDIFKMRNRINYCKED